MSHQSATDIWRCQRLIHATRKGEAMCNSLHPTVYGPQQAMGYVEVVSAWSHWFPAFEEVKISTISMFLDGVPAEHNPKYDALIRHYVEYTPTLLKMRMVSTKRDQRKVLPPRY